jgi:glutamate:GABA antiporter
MLKNHKKMANALPRRTLSATSIALMTIAATDSLRNMPSMAVYGWSSVSWFLLGTLLFLVPIALVAAELATGWPIPGGVYAWVREAFGEEFGFLAVWCEWAQNVVWFPAILTFVATSLAYVINPELADNKLFLLAVMLTVFWGLTLVNLQGIGVSIFLQRVGVFAGTVIPQMLLILLVAVWLLQGRPGQISFSFDAMVPEINLGTLPLAATVILIFAGMEMSGYHALETKNPQRDFPRAIFFAAISIFILSVLSTLAIAIIVPPSQLSLAAGLMQAFSNFLSPFGLGDLMPLIALMISLGAVATLTTWMLGPAKGLAVAARNGNLPRIFSHENERQVPDRTLLIQFLGGTLFCLLLFLVPSVSASYWMLTAMTTQILAAMYILVFAAAIKLRYSQPGKSRPFRVPGGNMGIWIFALVGSVSCLFVIIIGFLPPGNFIIGDSIRYILLMLLGFVSLTCPPLIFYRIKKPEWIQAQSE